MSRNVSSAHSCRRLISMLQGLTCMDGLRPAHVGGDRHEGVVPVHRWRVGCDRHKAREPAGERTVSVNVGEVGSQILAAGLVDEVAMDVVPVVFGSRERYFGS